MNVIHGYLSETLGTQVDLPRSEAYRWTRQMAEALMVEWNGKLQAKLYISSGSNKKVSISLSVPTACAFILYFGWQPEPEGMTYLANTVIRIQNEIQKQL